MPGARVLLLIHQAYGDVFGTWRAMEKAYRAGKVRAIGVSNFQAGRFFDFAHYVELKPMVNQLQCNALAQQTYIEPIHAEFGTKVMAWGPLGGQGAEGIVKSEVLATGCPPLAHPAWYRSHPQINSQGAHGAELRHLRLHTLRR